MKISFSNLMESLKKCINCIDNLDDAYKRGNWADDVHDSYKCYLGKTNDCKFIFNEQIQKLDEIENTMNNITPANEIDQNVKRLKLEIDSVQV